MLEKIRKISMLGAEQCDAWRIFPRLFVAMYAYLMYSVFMWFKSIETQVVTKCNEDLVEKLVTLGTLSLDQINYLACSVTGVVGGPTTQHTVLVTTICGLATAIFGFYANSGRNWASLPPTKQESKKTQILTEQ